MWKNYLKIGFRNLLKNKTYTAINLLGLTIGVASTVLLFFYIQHQLSFDDFHHSKDSVYRVLSTYKNGDEVTKSSGIPLALKPVMEENFGSEMIFTNVVSNNFLSKVEGGEGFNQSVMMVSPAFFEMFSFKMRNGSYPKSSEMRADIVLSESTSKKYFGNEDPVGKNLLIRLANDFVSFNVAGVIEDAPANSSLTYELLMLDTNADILYTAEQREHWYMVFGDGYIMVKEPAQGKIFEEAMQAYIKRLFTDREDPIDYTFSLQPLSDIHMNTDIPEGTASVLNPRILWILGAIGLLIILIACINFTTMAIGNSAGRAKEVGVRKSMGAGSGQLFGQFMAESVLITFASLGLGILLAIFFLPTFNKLMDTGLAISFLPVRVFIILGLGVFISLLAGFYPAVFLTSFKPVEVLKSNMSLKFGKQGLRLTLLGFQFFISIFLITCTLVMYRQMKTIENHELGINHTAILQINVPPPASQGLGDFINKGFEYGQVFKNEVQKMSEVEKVAMATSMYGDNAWFSAGFDTPEDKNIEFRINIVDENFADIFGLDFIEGRNFMASIPSDRTGGFILNESMRTALGWDSVFGNSLESKRGFPENRAIGLVKDFHFESLYREVSPAIMILSHDNFFPGLHSLMMNEQMNPKIFVKIQSKDMPATVSKINGIWKALYGSDPFNYSFLDDTIANQYTQDQSLRTLVSIAAILAIIIAGLGLFAMASLTIASRIKEIGIRKVLGATTMEISILFNKQFLSITVIGIVLALPVSYYMMQQWLNDFAVKTQMSIWIFIVAIFIGILFSVFIVSAQTIKSSWSNPVKSLKSD
ncbi:ABC transporter permease [Aquiflexum gelatinilyticum]|uniref:ABC transporter permease n=1 Tax=Aquiflexum gelatinilyticum TaxID=2961943 RepID=UPI002166F125|nr:FtsX-like permease family protein [Aquiflexum gelatinilyticum]MCS4435299.1 ABC transporter permease [Aquiflexum gelatinilyticum]